MNDIGNRIREARTQLKMSVKELSDKTKVRQFVIESIEKGDFSVMPEVYIKSFIKTLAKFLKIDYVDEIISAKPIKSKKKNFDDELVESTAPIKSNTNNYIIDFLKKSFEKSPKVETSHFAELFKKRKLDKDKRYMYLNKTIYIILFLAVVAAIYFAFASLNKSSVDIDNSEILSGSDTVSLETESDNLFSFFEKSDSLRLSAKAHDTVWIRVLVDGKSLYESLLNPGMEESWAANEFFIVDLGNVGGAKIYRNDELLPQFGKTGSVVKNIKITATEVLNTYSIKSDSLKASRKRAERDKPIAKPKLIEQSKIQTSPQFPIQKKDTLRF